MPPSTRLHTELFRRHISYTQGREEIYGALKRYGPCRIQDLVQKLATQYDPRTVYRTINLFLKIGVAVKLSSQLIELNYPFSQHHHHLICTQCGRRVDFWDEAVERTLDRLATKRGFTVTTHQLEFTGRCRLCSLAPTPETS